MKAGGVTVHPHRLSKVMRIILDSGAIYTICVIVFFGTTLAGSNAQYGVSDVVVQVIVRTTLLSYLPLPHTDPRPRESPST